MSPGFGTVGRISSSFSPSPLLYGFLASAGKKELRAGNVEEEGSKEGPTSD